MELDTKLLSVKDSRSVFVLCVELVVVYAT